MNSNGARVTDFDKILVTGATGFIGHAFVGFLLSKGGHSVRVALRREGLSWPDTVERAYIEDLASANDWSKAVNGVRVVVHTAARVHVMQENSSSPLNEFRRVNVQGTLSLARQAAAAGVRRFVFVSSIKVNGEATRLGSPFTADDMPAPLDAYGISKLEAEQGLRQIAAETGMEVVVVRPPLVYGPGVRANFQTLLRAVARGLPLPLGAIDNRRSLVALDNLVDLIVTCISHPHAANQTFLVSDGEDVSTPELIRRMARAMGRPARLIPVPVWLLKVGAALPGKQDMAQRLCGSLLVDIEKTRRLLGWTPPISLDEGLRRVAGGVAVNKH